MSFRPASVVLGLFAGGVFGAQLHLALETHDAVHEEAQERDSQGSSHEPHPSADHEIAAVVSHFKKPQPAAAGVVVFQHAVALADEAQSIERVITQTADPPRTPESPPRGPRAPPSA
jgi:hypothetical protein